MSDVEGLTQTVRSDAPITCRSDQQLREEDCLVRLKGIAKRRGDTLRLSLENGKMKTFTSNSKACEAKEWAIDECVVFKLVGYEPRHHFFVVQEGYYECAVYNLVSSRTGTALQISTVPEFSPRGVRFISVDSNNACHGHYDLAIWSTANDPPSLEFQHSPKDYEAWEFLGWQSDDRINLKVGFHSGQGKDVKWHEEEVKAVHTGKNWQLERGNPTESK
jgi:hypothetical protein